jgi:RimJ/RimL family protein N-acetyltransferase
VRPPPAPGRLDDGVVELRPLTVADAEDHLAGQDDELARWLGATPRTARGTLNWLYRCEECWRLGGPIFAFGVRSVNAAPLLGTVEMRVGGPGVEPGQAEIRYGLFPQARGRRVAVRACRLGCTFALGALTVSPWDVREVVAHIDPFNTGSLRVIHHAGFRHVDMFVGAGAAWELYVRASSRPRQCCPSAERQGPASRPAPPHRPRLR